MPDTTQALLRDDHYDVAVIGCGPTGATLTNLLSLYGLKVLVLEREIDIYPLPRAVHFDDETMRIFQLAGIAAELKQKVRVNPGMRFVAPDGELLLDWPRPQETGRHGWNTSYRLHQPDLEKLLRVQLTRHANTTVAPGVELSDLQQYPSHVELACKQRATLHSQTVSAKYVVGCDGARSTLRSFMHSTYEDLGFHQRWLVVDVLLKRDMPELGDYTLQFCDPEQPMTYCRNPGLRRRWEMALTNELSDADALDPQYIWSLLARWITPVDAELERKAIYTFRSAVAKSWQNRRLLIAGDAAHLTPPFMGQGMCAGIRDAANLAWKLALCLKVDNPQMQQTLLTSYQQERSPHVCEYINTAVELGKMMSAIDRCSATANSHGGTATMKSLQPVFNDNSIARYFNLPVSPDTGYLFGQPVLADGMLMDDMCGYRPVLISRQAGKDYTTSRPESVDVKDPYKTITLSAAAHPQLTAALDELQVNAVLLRPDRYILSSAVSSAEVAALNHFSSFV